MLDNGASLPTRVSSLSIIVPVLDEEDNVIELQKEIVEALEPLGIDYEVIYVDDGSTDNSYDRLLELYGQWSEIVRIVRLRRNFGQTAAIAAGLDFSRGDVVIPIDADLQNDPADIRQLIAKIEEGYDLVSGWRATREDRFWSRRLPSKVANWIISRVTAIHLHDYGCTLKAYRREVVEHINLYGEMHRFLPALASSTGARVAEVKVNHRARKHGTSKYGIDRVQRVTLDLVTVAFLLSYSTRPMQIFGKWGFFSIFIGGLSGLLSIILKILPPFQDMTASPWIYMCMFFVLGGLQLVSMGLLGEINVRTYYESQRKPIYSVRNMVGKSAHFGGKRPRSD